MLHSMETARDLTLRLERLLHEEHGALADFLLALADFDARRAFVELGHASLFAFLVRDLHLSKGAAFYRATAAGLVRRFPEILEPLRSGKLCLTTVVEVAKVLTPENREKVLPRFFGLGRREAQELVAELQPREAPVLRDVVTVPRPPPPAAAALRLPAPPGPDLGHEVSQPTSSVPGSPSDARAVTATAPSAPPAQRPAPDAVEPLTAELTRIHVTVPRRLLAKLEAARAALSHSHPGAGMAEILEAGLDLVLDRHAKRNGLVERPRKVPRPTSDPDRIPARIRRAVWKRDGGKCQSPVASGGVCGSTVGVELHHVRSRSSGGPPTVKNLETLCAFHHDLETRREFGDDLVERCVQSRRGRARQRSGSTGGAGHDPAGARSPSRDGS